MSKVLLTSKISKIHVLSSILFLLVASLGTLVFLYYRLYQNFQYLAREELERIKIVEETKEIETSPSKHSLEVAAQIYTYSSEENRKELETRFGGESAADFIRSQASIFDKDPAELAHGEAWVQKERDRLGQPVTYQENTIEPSLKSDRDNTSSQIQDNSRQLDAISNCLRYGGAFCNIIP